MSEAQEPNTVDFEVTASLTFLITLDTNKAEQARDNWMLFEIMCKEAWKDAVYEWIMHTNALPDTVTIRKA